MNKYFIKTLIEKSQERGSSLVQVMVIAGMVSVFSLAVMQTQKNVKSVKSTVMVRDANQDMKTAITSLLKYPDVCKKNFDFLNSDSANTVSGATNFKILNTSRIQDVDGNFVFQKYASNPNIKYFGRARIKEIKYGHYDATKNVLTLRVTTANKGSNFNLFNLGGSNQDIDIAIRAYFNSTTKAMSNCMAEDTPPQEIYDSAPSDKAPLLAQLCTSRLGGSFWNGDCKLPENIQRKARSSSLTNAPGQQDNFCQNFGGEYDVNLHRCKPSSFSNEADLCATDGQILAGFDANGIPNCITPP